MLGLFPKIHPYAEYKLKLTVPHELYIEESGSADGIPVLVLHGGPGAGSEIWQRSFFDPEKYRIIVFDQRGCGKSTPHCCVENNTTQDLVADIELIRKKLDIDQWVVFGGSWGSTLALVYAQAHPDQVLSMILRGIFLCREAEIKWFYQSGANKLFPDYWEKFIEPISSSEQHDMLNAYYHVLRNKNEIKQLTAAKAWSTWEGSLSSLQANHSIIEHFAQTHTALSLAKIETHYFINKCFLEENQILINMHKIQHIPAILVHGRYDVVCPLENAMELHRCWNESRLEIIANAGHSAKEPGIIDALIKASDEIAKIYKA